MGAGAHGPRALALTDTLSRAKRPFEPRDPAGPVRLYSCGPSVYQRQHLGNYRTFLFEDVLQRYLEHLGHGVERLIYLTDIEDKAVSEARRLGLGLGELTAPNIERFFDEARLLELWLPDPVPRSSTCVDTAACLVQRLVESGHAYRHGRSYYFDPLTYQGFGQLFGLDLSRWPDRKVRFHRDTYPGHRWNLGDFILWHGARPGEPESWDSPLGPGRPSWNVQDPAVIVKHLGPTVDLSCGGVDNLYRHHDYLRAIMESYSGETYAGFWLHGGLLTVRGRKMSKRRGNTVYLEDLLGQGFSPRHVRFFLIYGQYRDGLDLTEAKVEAARARLEQVRGAAEAARRALGSGEAAPGLLEAFRRRMDDDLDVRGAVDAVAAGLDDLARSSRPGRPVAWASVRAELDDIDAVLRVGL